MYLDFSNFTSHLKTLLSDLDGYSASRLNSIAMIMSEMCKIAVVQKDKKGNVITDPTTKDTELIKLTKPVEEYFEEEVYPHVPDAMWFDDEKKGAEFPFTRFFYKYQEPEKADDLLAQFMELEKSLAEKISALQESEVL